MGEKRAMEKQNLKAKLALGHSLPTHKMDDRRNGRRHTEKPSHRPKTETARTTSLTNKTGRTIADFDKKMRIMDHAIANLDKKTSKMAANGRKSGRTTRHSTRKKTILSPDAKVIKDRRSTHTPISSRSRQ